MCKGIHPYNKNMASINIINIDLGRSNKKIKLPNTDKTLLYITQPICKFLFYAQILSSHLELLSSLCRSTIETPHYSLIKSHQSLPLHSSFLSITFYLKNQ
jgi:hypothetical protein